MFELTLSLMANASQMAYVEEAHGTLAMLENYNEVFRYLTGSMQSVTLFNELEILAKYITVQKMRYGDRFNVSFVNQDQNKGIFISHLTIIDVFDSVLHAALERYEGTFNIFMDLEAEADNSVKITLETEESRESFIIAL